jgi:hypothetical protein
MQFVSVIIVSAILVSDMRPTSIVVAHATFIKLYFIIAILGFYYFDRILCQTTETSR